MSSSILTPSQSGIIGEGGRKVLKTRVQLLGRFLLEPGDELTLDAARRLAERARAARVRVRTHLTLFSAGMRLGERGAFASLPLEFVKYHRLSDLVAPGAGHPAVLVVCVRDFDQRSATVVRFKDDVCLRVVVDVIERHRRAWMEDDVARLSDLQSSYGTYYAKRGGGGGNWRLSAAAADTQEASTSTVDGRRQEVATARVTAATASTLTEDEGDYAVIRRSRMLAESLGSAAAQQAESSPPHRSSSGGGGHGGGSRPDSHVEEQQVRVVEVWQQPRQQQQQQQYYQKHREQQQQGRQLHQTNWTFTTSSSNGAKNNNGLATIPDVDADIEEAETTAIFETPDGPPTLLNELVRRGGDSGGGIPSRRVMELPPEFVARARVSARSSDAEQPGSAAKNGGEWPDED